jgi:glycosyltransferase involved in cell wall biosynthesis
LSHPIQHFVPWFRSLHERLGDRFLVMYASRHGLDESFDREFGEGFQWDMDLSSGYPHIFVPTTGYVPNVNRKFWGIRFPNARKILDENGIGAVMLLGWQYLGYWQIAMAARRLGIPYILRGESNLLGKGGRWKWWLKTRTMGWLSRNAYSCLAIGRRNADLYRAYGVPDHRISTALYFVDNHWFASEAQRLLPQRDSLRDRFGLPRDAVVFLFMGKLIEKKHPDHLLEAWQLLPADLRQRSALLFCGSGSQSAVLRERSGEERLVQFSGFLNRPQLPEAYAVSDVLVLPSDERETWGLVVNEACASGLPSVVSDRVGCADDLVADGASGFVYPFGDRVRLGECLAELVRDSGLRLRLGGSARERVSQATADAAAARVEELLNAIQAKSSRLQ